MAESFVTLSTGDKVGTDTHVNGANTLHKQQFVPKKGDGTDIDFATATKQTELAALIGEVQATPTANTLLGRIRALALQLPASLGAKLATASLSVTMATDDLLVAVFGAKADTSATTDTGTFSLIALMKRGLEKFTLTLTALGAIGDAAWASGNGSVIALLKTIASAAASTAPAQTVGLSLRPSASFTRPANATPYDVGDLVANNTTAGSVTPMVFTVAASSGGKGLIRSVKIDKAGAAATFRAHFFLATPTPTNGDNGVFSTTKAGYLGPPIDIVTTAFSDGAVGVGLGEIHFDLTGTTDVVCLLEARTAFTPTSGGAFTVEVTSWPEV